MTHSRRTAWLLAGGAIAAVAFTHLIDFGVYAFRYRALNANLSSSWSHVTVTVALAVGAVVCLAGARRLPARRACWIASAVMLTPLVLVGALSGVHAEIDALSNGRLLYAPVLAALVYCVGRLTRRGAYFPVILTGAALLLTSYTIHVLEPRNIATALGLTVGGWGFQVVVAVKEGTELAGVLLVLLGLWKTVAAAPAERRSRQKLTRARDVEYVMEQRLLVVSPVRNEAAHFERVAMALAAQTRRPDLWLVVDDHSTDESPQLLAQLAQRWDFMSVISTQTSTGAEAPKDRMAIAAPPKAFNLGLRTAGWQAFTHIAKLDGDIELPPRYFELLLEEFDRDPGLGLAGGVLLERDGDGWGKEPVASDYHVRGGLKCYSRECLEAIGGIQERLAWDAIDEIYARMHGYKTRTLSGLVARHYRPTASADGILRGRARHGRCAYIVHFTIPWVTLRAFKVARERPRGLSGIAFLYGYLKAAIVRVPRVDDPEFRSFVRDELRDRARDELAERVPLRGGPLSLAGREN